MTIKEFHRFTESHYNFLESYGYVSAKKRSTWRKDLNVDRTIEIVVLTDKYTWNILMGGKFMVMSGLLYKGNLLNQSAKQFTLLELRNYNPNIFDEAVDCFEKYRDSLPPYKDAYENRYLFELRTSWTRQRVEEDPNIWFHFYDQENLEVWLSILKRPLLQAINAMEKEYLNINVDIYNSKSEYITYPL